MFCNNKRCLQFYLYGISKFLSFKIINFFIVHNLAIYLPVWITVMNFTSRFTTSRLRSSHFVFYEYPETSGAMRNGYTYWSPPQSRKVEMEMRKWQRLKHRNRCRSVFRLLDLGIYASHLKQTTKRKTNELWSLFNPFLVIKIFWKRFFLLFC